MKIEEVMNKKVYTCRPEDSMKSAAQLMWQEDIGCIPVIDGAGKAIGMVTDRDLLMSTYLTGKRLEDLPVSQAMAKEVYSARLGQSVESAGALMRSKQVRRLPIVDSAGKLAGIVSLNDLALAGGRARAVKPEDVTATLASICQPRHASHV